MNTKQKISLSVAIIVTVGVALLSYLVHPQPIKLGGVGITPEPAQIVPIDVPQSTLTLDDKTTAIIQKTDNVKDVANVPIVIETTGVTKSIVTLKQLNVRIAATQATLDKLTAQRDALEAQLNQ